MHKVKITIRGTRSRIVVAYVVGFQGKAYLVKFKDIHSMYTVWAENLPHPECDLTGEVTLWT